MLMLVTATTSCRCSSAGRASACLLSADRLLVRNRRANAAAIKAFVVNRIGDFGFALGILAVFFVFGSRRVSTRFSPRHPNAGRPDTSTSSAPRSTCSPISPCCCSSARWASRRSSAAHLAARRDGRPDAGLRADPRRNDGDGRRVPGGALFAAVRAGARCADRGHLGRRVHGVLRRDRRSGAERHQAGRSPIRPVRSSATCSRAAASAPMALRSSTCSRTPSSRRCCSLARGRSSTACRRAGHAQDGREPGAA